MKSRSVCYTVAEQILALIQSGEFPVGSKLPSERELAERLAVGRGTLREAMRVLGQKQVLQQNHGGGRYILRSEPLDENEDVLYAQLECAAVTDLLEAREILDDAIIPMACMRATEKDMEEIDLAYQKMLNCEKLSPVSLDAGELFHLSVARATHNQVFIAIYTANLEIFQQIRVATFRAPERKKEMIQEHIAIYKAIKERDELTARLAARLHLRSIRQRYDSIRNVSLAELKNG